MADSNQWNLRNPAVKRIVQELKEIQRDDNPDILAEALEVTNFPTRAHVLSKNNSILAPTVNDPRIPSYRRKTSLNGTLSSVAPGTPNLKEVFTMAVF